MFYPRSSTREVIKFIVAYLLLCFGGGYSGLEKSELLLLNDCICLGQQVTYECTVLGDGATAWTGSLFDCTSNEIVLRHRQFHNMDLTTGECNDGAVTARSVRVVNVNNNTLYSSQLNINMTLDVNNKNITCLHVNDIEQTVVNTSIISLTTDAFPPPNVIHIMDIGPNFLTIHWESSHLNCPSIQYIITSLPNCGICPNVTTGTTITCNNIKNGGQLCNYFVQTEICGTLLGRKSKPLSVKLQGANPPQIQAVSYLNCTSKKDISITLQLWFNESSPFNITEDIDGSATAYFIEFTDYLSGNNCASVLILPSSCINGVCNYSLTVGPSSSCFSSMFNGLTVIGFAENILGNGPKSNPLVVLVPQIDGSLCHSPAAGLGLTIPMYITSVALFVTTSLAITLIIVITITCLSKKTNNKKKSAQEKPSSIYEDVAEMQQLPHLSTSDNVAYCPLSIS